MHYLIAIILLHLKNRLGNRLRQLGAALFKSSGDYPAAILKAMLLKTRWWRLLALFMPIIILPTLFFTIWSRKPKEQKEQGLQLAVEVETVKRGNLEQVIGSPGTVVHLQKATISSKVTGRVAAIFAQVGEEVKQGQLLARLETEQLQLRLREMQAALRSAQAELALARSIKKRTRRNIERNMQNLQRLQAEVIVSRTQFLNSRRRLQVAGKLYNIGGISPADLRSGYSDYLAALSTYYQARKGYQIEAIGFRDRDLQEANFKISPDKKNRQRDFMELNSEVEQNQIQAAEALVKIRKVEIEATRFLIKEAQITAPIAGVVVARNIEAGEEVAQAALFTIVGVKQLLVSISVAEEELQYIQIGQEARCTVDAYRDHNIKAKVYMISPIVATDTRAVDVRLIIDNSNGKIYPGMFLRCQVKVREKAMAIAIPAKALQDGALFILREGFAIRREITTGERYGKRIEVRSGLREGEKVIVSQLARLREGLRVIPKTER